MCNEKDFDFHREFDYPQVSRQINLIVVSSQVQYNLHIGLHTTTFITDLSLF